MLSIKYPGRNAFKGTKYFWLVIIEMTKQKASACLVVERDEEVPLSRTHLYGHKHLLLFRSIIFLCLWLAELKWRQ